MAAKSSGGGGGGLIPAAGPTPAYGSTSIGGTLNFGGGGGSMYSGGMAGLSASYNSAYNSALAANQQNYNNILGGYQQTAYNQRAGENAVIGGYNTLTNQVLSGISGSGEAQKQAIDDNYARQMGAASQQLTNTGLNNSTIAQSTQRGISLDQNKAQTDLANQMAQLDAQYRSSLGLAGLQYQGHAVDADTGLAVNQLNWMNSVQIPYPDAAAYSNLAMMYGSQAEADKNRQAMQDMYNQGLAGASQPMGGGGFSGVYGTQPMPYYPNSSPSSYTPQGAGGQAYSGSPGASYAYSPGGSSGYAAAPSYNSYASGYSDDGYQYLDTGPYYGSSYYD